MRVFVVMIPMLSGVMSQTGNKNTMKVLVVLISLLSIVKSQKNLAPNGTASQSSVYYWGARNLNLTADLAITGGPTYDFQSASCSATLDIPIQYVAWWMLTFAVDTVYITNVKMYYRFDALQHLAGYSLYVSNSSTTKTGGHLCYHHIGPGLPDKLQMVNCNHLGKNVIFYNERDKDNIPTGYSDFAILELCHVEIYGCYKGWWGGDCSTPCPVNCTDGHCYPDNGSCVWGCKIGQDGDMCDRQCDTGTYGDNCGSRCDTCVNRICDRIDGRCIYGCIDGFKGHDCQLTASPQSAEQTTNDIALYVGVTGTFMATVLMCVIIFQAISRYRRKKRDGSENPRSGQKNHKFVNNVFIDDYAAVEITRDENDMYVSNGWNEGRRIVELDARCNDKGRCTAAGVTCHYIYPIQLVRGPTSIETHYEETSHPFQEQPYDSI